MAEKKPRKVRSDKQVGNLEKDLGLPPELSETKMAGTPAAIN
jgi:hypothetical protein